MVTLFLSIAAVGGISYVYYRFNKQFSELSDEMSDMQRDVESLQIESEAFGQDLDQESLDKDELFEENVRNLAEKLFALLKTKHGMEDVTTYREMEDVIEDMDTDDEKLKEELMNFYESAIRLEYSDEELDEQERERMKQTAVDLIKRTGQSLG
jgi:hypothetical protein